MWASIRNQPLFLLLMGISAVSMYVPAFHALVLKEHFEARAFFYSGTLFLLLVSLIGLAMLGRKRHRGAMGDLLALFACFSLLPVMLAVPFHEAVQTTSFLNAYVEMVSSLTTTGATLFDADRLTATQHLWRAQVGWMGGLLMWVAAAAILAPLNLGGFEVTASAEPGQGDSLDMGLDAANPQRRILRITSQLFPIYVGLTLALWIMLVISGDTPLVAICHAMSVMATSGISPVGGAEMAQSGIPGEAVMALFMLFALSRLTFSSDTITTARRGIHHDPEFRLGLVLVVCVPLLLFLRHWVGTFEGENNGDGFLMALRALWGGVFTTLSFLSTTGFESAEWATAQNWSGLKTPGLIFLGLALIGGGVATTAGGVKLLRVWALYLNGLREMERLVHPSSVGRSGGYSRRLRKQGAYIAWIFFMLFALSISAFTVAFSGLGLDFENAIILSISALSTTGPLIGLAPEDPISLLSLGAAAKAVFCAGMVLGRLEMLAIIALLTSDVWRS
ncbi:trk system potassium uptake protein TrkH [Thalassovita litoralis]|jgi:trk system potassium uptake protein TrkH|uniref:Trk system potassium uptake protein TrkH n=1 Tax=Thalassovita litoralis TaxID=1010611 RepID=A0A521BU36_9RHOB|nr:potassium transporter TrkG [Thalassovita litoralis]SMO50668.1 trk system potassium uptake protein TrkH [Thalassovita litoralis]